MRGEFGSMSGGKAEKKGGRFIFSGEYDFPIRNLVRACLP